jgi:hypothetical protein
LRTYARQTWGDLTMLRLLLSTGNIFISLVLGALALAFVGLQSPETLSVLISWARELKIMLTSTGLDPKYNIWLELLLEERQLLFMMFTIAARIVLGIICSLSFRPVRPQTAFG